MKKGHFLTVSLILSVFLLSSCEKDNVSRTSSGSSNYFSYDGQKYNLDKGFIENYGDNENGSYDFDVFLVSDSIDYSFPDQDYKGVGEIVYLDLNTSSENGLVSGKYNFSSDRDTFTLVDGLIGIKMDINTEEGEELVEIVAGEVDVSVSGSNTVIDFDLTTSTNKKVTGKFNKKLTNL